MYIYIYQISYIDRALGLFTLGALPCRGDLPRPLCSAALYRLHPRSTTLRPPSQRHHEQMRGTRPPRSSNGNASSLQRPRGIWATTTKIFAALN